MEPIENYTGCYIGLQSLWKNNKKKQFAESMQRNLSYASNPFKLTLVCIKLCPDLFKSKNNGMPVALALELQTFIDKQHKSYSDCLTDQMQIDVFQLAIRQKNTGMMRVLTKVYRLGDVREQIVPMLRAMIVEEHYKEVCTFATLLDLQDCFSTEELIVPLFCLDRLCLADEFLASSPKHQKETVIFLDRVLGKEPEATRLLEKFNVTNVGQFKSSKVLGNVLGRLLKRFQLDMSICPHLYKRRSVGGLRYLFYKYYIEKGLQKPSFHSLVEDAVHETPDLKYTLIDLFCEYCDPQSAVPYIHKFKIDYKTLPKAITDAMLACQADSFRSVAVAAPEECWEENEDSYTLSIPQENIILIDSVEEFDKSMIELTKSSILGLDSEWKPSFGVGSGEQVSLMQLATPTHAYLIDIITLQPLMNDSHWMQLGNLFTNANITKLGYGIKNDFKILAKLHSQLKKALTTPKNVIDFDSKKAVLLETLPGIFPFNNSTYKGLSDLVYRCFGKPLDKSEQFSNWAHRPLTRSQKVYAGLDAICLIDIYNHLNVKSQELGLSSWQNLKVTSPPRNSKAEKKGKKKEQSPDKSSSIQRSQGPIEAKNFHVVCDTMLQGLAKKLRLCGIDAVALENGQSCDDCIEFYEKEQRYVLSRGNSYRRLAKFIPANYLYHVENEGLQDQLVEVLNTFSVRMDTKDVFTRCTKCNSNKYISVSSSVMKKLFERDEASQCDVDKWVDCEGGKINLLQGCIENGTKLCLNKITKEVLGHVDTFKVCGQCGKCYWEGFHQQTALTNLQRQLCSSKE
ncbi:exonuclease mut-7 homolog isoform X2 [Palaemon carinicauda]|uniref:exonuclease mut-7 homolog isoform X2 n=1 Tax=Palaemon carinicauda TaxID=392227 RepID=UPI0035B57B47